MYQGVTWLAVLGPKSGVTKLSPGAITGLLPPSGGLYSDGVYPVRYFSPAPLVTS